MMQAVKMLGFGLVNAQFFQPMATTASFSAAVPSFSGAAAPSFLAPATSFFSPAFALSPLPNVPLGFPAGFGSQQLFMPSTTVAAKSSKKSDAGVYNPNPSPPDPQASQTITNLLTSPHDMPIFGKGAPAIQAMYDQGSFRSINMEMDPQNIAIINVDPTQELAVHCRVTLDYNTPQARVFNSYSVGCGYKGSVGSLRVCLDEYHHDNHICRKLSFRIDARRFEVKKAKNATSSDDPLFYGAKTLEFGGMPVDLSMMSERTAFNLMTSLGMYSPLASHAKLFLNGKYLGLFSFVQPVDDVFTSMHFGKDAKKGKGGLYKELWFNPLHMQDIASTHHGGTKDDEPFLREVMSAIESTSLYGNAPQAFFDQYFDTQSLIDLTAFNTVIGNTDDWRQRHNFFLYVRHDLDGTKKVVWIPWDYDRIYDTGAATRGALKGKPWWDIQDTATPTACNQPLQSTQAQAAAMGGTPARIAWNKDILDQFPLDINVPVTCDKLTQLMANALGTKIRQRTREMASQISMTQIKAHWATWNAQIQTALQYDPAGPTYSTMIQQQGELAQHISDSMQKAVQEANLEDGISSPSFSSPFSASWSPAVTSPAATGWTPAVASPAATGWTAAVASPAATGWTAAVASPSATGWTPGLSLPSFVPASAATQSVPMFTPSTQSFAPFAAQSFAPAFPSSSFVVG